MRFVAPPRRRPKVRAWVLAVAAVVLALLAVVVTAPRWGTPLVKARLADRLEQRIRLPVHVDGLELGFGHATLTGIEIGRAAVGPRFRFERVWIELDRSALLRGRVVVREVMVAGGKVQATRTELEDWLASVRDGRGRNTGAEPRTNEAPAWLPARVRIDGMELDLADRRRGLELRALARADVWPHEHRVSGLLERIDVELGKERRIVARSVRSDAAWTPGGGLAFPLRADVRGIGAAITDRISVAGVDGWIAAADASLSELELDLAGSFADDTLAPEATTKLWSASGRLRRDLSAGHLELDMDAFELGRVPQVLQRLPLVDSEHATVGGHVVLAFGRGLARVEGKVALHGLNVDHRTLAREVVRDVGFDLAFAAEVDPVARRLSLLYADVDRRDVRVSLVGEFEHPARAEGRRYRAELTIAPVSCQTLLDAIPRELVPSLVDFELGGTFDAAVQLNADFADLDALTLGGNVGIAHCTVRRTPPHASVTRLAGGFTHTVQMKDGRLRTLQLYPGSHDFTPLELVSPYMIEAVLTTEDGGFRRHHGFLPSQFEVALRRNLSKGRIELGASTITMQMVKNVLLGHERTLARKLQEMFLTWYVEVVLGKDRIMELYLNAIEYGPGIYGITRAAAHYFGKHPADLTPPEAVYLALMLPDPVRRHAQYCRGGLTDGFQVKVQRILDIMRGRERLSPLDHEIWKDGPIVFDLRARQSERDCYGEIERVAAGEFIQHALSGLLGGVDVSSLAGTGGRERAFLDVDAPGRPAMDEP